MNNNSRDLRGRKYLLLFVFVMVLNVLLAGFLLLPASGQSSEIRNQKPLAAEIVAQGESPLVITVINVDNVAEAYQTVNYSVQNVSSKKIKAYVLHHANQSSVGGTNIRFFQSFAPGQIIQDSFSESRLNLKTDEKIFLSVDYVAFEDGSAWGKDSQKQSEYVSGYKEGQRKAVNQARQLLADMDKNALLKLLQQQSSEINPPEINEKKNERWLRGYVLGYRVVHGGLRGAYEKQGAEAVSSKLDEMEKFIKAEDK
jgi:hypothetical protein